MKKGDNLLQDEVTFEEDTNPALTLINMAKESAKYKTRMEEINGFNKVIFSVNKRVLFFYGLVSLS